MARKTEKGGKFRLKAENTIRILPVRQNSREQGSVTAFKPFGFGAVFYLGTEVQNAKAQYTTSNILHNTDWM